MSLVIEFSPPEEARLQAAAEREGMPIADIIRKAVTNYARKEAGGTRLPYPEVEQAA